MPWSLANGRSHPDARPPSPAFLLPFSCGLQRTEALETLVSFRASSHLSDARLRVQLGMILELLRNTEIASCAPQHSRTGRESESPNPDSRSTPGVTRFVPYIVLGASIVRLEGPTQDGDRRSSGDAFRSLGGNACSTVRVAGVVGGRCSNPVQRGLACCRVGPGPSVLRGSSRH